MKSVVNHALVLALIVVSGNPAVREFSFEAAVVALFLAAGLVFMVRPKSIPPGAVFFMLAVAALLACQIVVWGRPALFASIGVLVQVATGFLIASALPNFVPVLARCMAGLSAMALFFYFVFQVPGRMDVLEPLAIYSSFIETHIGLHNFRGYGYLQQRNSGMFWEPGAFAGYLAITLFLIVLLRGRLPRARLIVPLLLAALLSTLSTMGYVALLVVIAAWAAKRLSGTHPVIAVLLLPMVVATIGGTAWLVGDQLPFLADKVVSQFEEAEKEDENAEINRFGNVAYDMRFVAIRPLLGWSANPETRMAVDFDADLIVAAQGNALSGMAARYGVIGWLLFMGGFMIAFARISGSMLMTGAGMVLIAVTFTGEQYMNYPLIMVLFFLERRHVMPETAGLVMRRRRRRKVGRRTSIELGA